MAPTTSKAINVVELTYKISNGFQVAGKKWFNHKCFFYFWSCGRAKRTVYSMTKFGVEGLTKGMALDLAKYNIRVNSVCPNIVLTPRTKKYFADKKYNKYVKENTPMSKVVTVSDVATSITFLASEAASMITGSSIVIDGGWTAK